MNFPLRSALFVHQMIFDQLLSVALRRAALTLLAAGCCALNGAAGSTAGAQLEPDEAVESARETLSKGVFSRHPWYDNSADDLKLVPLKPPPPPPRQRNWDWPDWNWDFGLFGSSFSVNLFSILAWLVVLVVVLFLIRYLIRLYERRENEEAEGDAEEIASPEDRVEALPAPVTRSRHDLLGEARRLYEQGNFNEAIVYLYSHLLVQLDRRQIIRLAKGKTNRQYLRECGREPSLRPLLERTMISFEDAYFGRHALNRQQFESCWNDLPQFERLLGPQEAAA